MEKSRDINFQNIFTEPDFDIDANLNIIPVDFLLVFIANLNIKQSCS